MIKRATSDVELIKNRFPEETKDLFENIEKLLPDNEDLIGAVEGLLRLQKTYKLESSAFANGFIGEKKSRAKLSAHDLFVIGKKAYAMPGEEFFAREYLLLSSSQIKKGEDVDEEVNEQQLFEMLTRSYNATSEYKKAIEFVKILNKKFPLVSEYKEWKESFTQSFVQFGSTKEEKVKNWFDDNFEKNGRFSIAKEIVLYNRACRGELRKSFDETSKLCCRFVSNSPFSKISPFKVEELNHKPDILLFHNVLSDSEIELLIDQSKPKTSRASVFTAAHNKVKSNSRVAQFAWHSDSDHEVIRKLSQRIEVSGSFFLNESR